MSSWRHSRQPWEYAGGELAVGTDVPITSEARQEQAPGVPDRPSDTDDASNGPEAKGSEEREVRAGDPELSPHTNERLTAELREVIGSDRVRVPIDRPHASRGEHPQQHAAAALLNMHRFQLLRSLAIVLTFGAIVSLATGHWWLLPLAAGVHALGTMTVLLTSIRMTTISEHPSPEVAAALTEEGISSPDEHFSRMVDEFREEPERGTAEVISPDFNDRDAPADTDTAAASAEQSSAMTPTSQPSRPAGEGGAPDLLIWATAASLLVLSLLLPAVTGGRLMWLLPAVTVPLLGGWVLMQRLMTTRQEQAHLQRGQLIVAIIACTTIAVAVFCAVIAIALQH